MRQLKLNEEQRQYLIKRTTESFLNCLSKDQVLEALREIETKLKEDELMDIVYSINLNRKDLLGDYINAAVKDYWRPTMTEFAIRAIDNMGPDDNIGL